MLQDTDNAVTHLQFSLDGQFLFSGARKVHCMMWVVNVSLYGGTLL